MNTTIKGYAGYALLVMMTFAISFNAVLAQEETEAAAETTTGSAGVMLSVLGLGILVILILGAAMNAQSKEDSATKE